MKRNETYTLTGECPHCEESLSVEVPKGMATVTCFSCGEKIVARLRIDPIESQRLYRDYVWLHTEYVQNERSMADIAQQCGVSPMTIFGWLSKHGIETRPRGGRKR